jgi:hypothetical protein
LITETYNLMHAYGSRHIFFLSQHAMNGTVILTPLSGEVTHIFTVDKKTLREASHISCFLQNVACSMIVSPFTMVDCCGHNLSALPFQRHHSGSFLVVPNVRCTRCMGPQEARLGGGRGNGLCCSKQSESHTLDSQTGSSHEFIVLQ